MKLYGFKDCKMGKLLNIFFADNNYTAMRDVSDVVNRKEENMFSRHPEDFQLFCYGDVDVETGVITPKLEFIENFVNLVKQDKQNQND